MMDGGNLAFPRFVAVGVANTVVGFATVLTASEWLGANAILANAAGLLAGFLLGFQLNRLWTFRGSRPVAMAMPRYLLAFALSYAINLGILTLALGAGLHPWLAQAVALAAYSVVFFCLCRLIVFPAAR